jgi:hypothetical protein
MGRVLGDGKLIFLLLAVLSMTPPLSPFENRKCLP